MLGGAKEDYVVERFETIEEISADSLKGKGKLLTPAGRELAFETVVTFDGDEFSGYLKIAIANIKIKNNAEF